MRLIGCSPNTSFRKSPDCCLPSSVWLLSRTTPCSSPDEHHGVQAIRCPAVHVYMHEIVQGAEHQQEAPTAPHLPLPAEKTGNHPNQSGLDQRHHLYSSQKWLSVSGTIMDWATRKVLTWRLSNTLDASFCVEALEEAIARYGKPEIMNTDQVSQYTGSSWITTLTKSDIKISMVGRGRYLDNIFIERLWPLLKQKAVYLHEITDSFKRNGLSMTGLSSATQSALTLPLISALRTSHTFGHAEIRKVA
jgi:putative transposase